MGHESANNYDRHQFEMLKKCSEKEDPSEWNQWRDDNRGIRVELQDAPLIEFDLRGINLSESILLNANFSGAKLNGATFMESELQGANFYESISNEGVDFTAASLKDANFEKAELRDAIFHKANLKGSKFRHSSLEGAQFQMATVNSKTYFWECDFDRSTNFTGVGLDSSHIDPRLKSSLKSNIREIQWKQWCNEETNRLKKGTKKAIVGSFWWVSDYGRSTSKIISTFFVLVVMFGCVYYYLGLIDLLSDPTQEQFGIIANLMKFGQDSPITCGNLLKMLVRAMYFSIVTMTTLGFGDMYADPDGWWGHIILSIHVLMGYAILGALVTRFSVLFTSDGPERNPDRPNRKDNENTR